MSRRILVVDDDPDLLEVLAYELKAQGYLVERAYNGEEALERMQITMPELIITDVTMPVMDGVDYYERLKKDPRTKQIPILVLTGSGELEKHFRTLGIDDFIAKPFEMEELHEKVNRLFAMLPEPESDSDSSSTNEPKAEKTRAVEVEQTNKVYYVKEKRSLSDYAQDLKFIAVIMVFFFILIYIIFHSTNLSNLADIILTR